MEDREYIPLTRPTFGAEEAAEVAATMRSGWVATGPRVSRFTTDLERYLGASDVVCLASCTAGLSLSLKLLELEPGDEVLLPAMTFVGCANVVVNAGCVPVLVDSDLATGLIDLDAAAAAVTNRTRAVMVVHLAGRPVDLDALGAFARRHGLEVVEDAAHAIGAAWRGTQIGASGNLTAFSFHASKNLSTFDGGALVTRSADEAALVRRLSVQGVSRTAADRHRDGAPGHYDVLEPGFKAGMHDIAAAAGIHQLRKLDAGIERRRRLAELYDELLAELPVRRMPGVPSHTRHAHHVYAVRIERPGVTRDDVATELHRRGVGTSVHFRAIHLHSWYREAYGLREEHLPNASRLSHTLLSLPLFPDLTETDVELVCAELASVLRVAAPRAATPTARASATR